MEFETIQRFKKNTNNEGFVRGKGLTVEDITFREIKGEEYVYVTKEEIGRPVEEIIPAVTEVLQALTFPVMRYKFSLL